MASVYWFTGISGAGKSTLAEMTYNYISALGRVVELLDGNDVRAFFDNDLGFTDEERFQALQRTVFGCHLLIRHNIDVVVASIAATRESRDFIRKKLGSSYKEIWVKASLETVQRRDVHGLYKRFNCKLEENLPGFDQKYDRPKNPDLILDTDFQTKEESFARIKPLIEASLFLKAV